MRLTCAILLSGLRRQHLLLCLMLSLLCGLAPAQGTSPPLFVPSPGPRALAVDVEGNGPVRVLRRQSVGISRDALDTIRSTFRGSATVRPRLQLNLFPDTFVPIEVRSIQPTHDGVGMVVRGIPTDDPDGQVIFSTHRGAMSGSVRLRSGEFYEIFVAPDGEGEVRQVELHPSEVSSDDFIVPEPDENGVYLREPRSRGSELPFAGHGEVGLVALHADGVHEIDILVAYTTRAKNARGGESGILAHINTVIAESNAAFANSMVNLQLRLVHAAEVSYDDSLSSMSYSAALESLQGETDGKMDEVHQLRATHGADLVALMVSPPGGTTIGISYLLPNWFPGDPNGPAKTAQAFSRYAFSVSHQSYAGGTSLTFPHEIGHNLGLHHDKDNGGAAGGIFPDARGYQQKTLQPKFYDIMAYSNGCSGCTPIANFSNPQVSYQGIPTGITDNTDGARALNFTAPYAAAWRTTTSCNYSTSPNSMSLPATVDSRSVSITAGAGCGWAAVSSVDWIKVLSPTTGTGNGSFMIQTTANPSGSSRTGTVSVAGRTITITQAGAPCSYTLSTLSLSAGSTGGTGSVAVTAPEGCSWNAVSQAGWIAVTGGASGSGNGTVSLSFEANPTSSQRNGTVTIAGQTVTVTQAGLACSFQLSTTQLSVPSGASSTTISVSSTAGCAWTAASNTAWITVTSGSSGSGNGSVTLSFAENPSISQRTGTLTIADQTVIVTQAALACSYTLNTASIQAASGAANATVSVSAPAGCAWTASSNTGWIAISGGSPGSGDGTVSIAMEANPNATQRTGTVTIAGQTVTVTQAPVACSFTLSTTNLSVGSGSGNGSVSVTAPAGCSWTASSNSEWITVSGGGSGFGNETVSLNIAANPAAVQRTGTVTIAGQTVTVTQAPVACSFTLNSTNLSVGSAAVTSSVSVTAPTGCSWTGSSNNEWISVSGGGNGNGSVTVNVAANPTAIQRTGTVTIAGQTVTVIQAPVACSFALNATSLSVGSGSGSASVSVTAPAGCNWTASSGTEWISVVGNASGSGSGNVSLTFSSNPTAMQRTGTVTIAGQTVTVTQAPVTCSFSLSASNLSVGNGSSSGSISVTAPTGCNWAASSGADWITLWGEDSGSGSGSVSLHFAANPAAIQRTGSVAIAGQTVTVTQAPAACSFALSAGNLSVESGAGSGAVMVTAPVGCAWTASSNSEWIAVTAGASGSGNGNVTLSFAANPAAIQRTGSVTIAGQTATVTQAPVPCSFGLGATDLPVGSASGNASVPVTAPVGCTWTAVSNSEWITVTGGASGSGNGSVVISVEANHAAIQRTGSVTIAGQSVAVAQAPAPCTYTLSNTSLSVPNVDGSASITVSSVAGCSWTAASGASWISVSEGAAGNGDGTVSLGFAANASVTPRTGTVTIAGQTVSITQSAAPCTYALSATSIAMTREGGTTPIAVSTASGCPWTASSQAEWISAAGEGNSNGSVTVTVAANPSQSSRTGTVTVGGRVVTVTQEAAPPPVVCSYSIAPTSLTAASTGGSYSVAVSVADTCTWNATSTVPWLQVAGSGEGTGSGNISIHVAANPDTTNRTGTVTLAGQSFTVVQQGHPVVPMLSLSQTLVVLSATTGTFSSESHVGVQTDTQASPFSIVGELPNWLTASPSQGTTPATIALRGNAQGIAVGTYQATVRVEAPGTANGFTTLDVTFHVTSPDPIRASPLALFFRTNQGGTSSVQRVSLRGGNGTAVMAQVIGAAPWLTVTTTSAPAGWNLRATATPAGLAVGTYDATIRVQCADNGCGSVQIPVRLQVTTTPTGDLPQIASGGLVNAASFAQGLAQGSWTSIFGTRLSNVSRMWDLSDFHLNRMPTELDGVRVSVAGVSAAVHYIGPTQVNFQVPTGISTGWAPVEVHTPWGSDLAYAYILPEAPGLFEVDAARQVAAVAADGRLVFRGEGGVPANPGQIVSLYGTGFGPTDPAVTAGEIFSGAARLLSEGAVSVTIGGVAAPIHFVGLSGAGLNQINVEIPNLQPGDHEVELMVTGKSGQHGAKIAVQ